MSLNDIVGRARRALEGTTPAPWVVTEEVDGVRAGRKTVIRADDPDLYSTQWCRKRVVTVDQTRPHHDKKAEANIAFIAEARTLIPEMIAEIERLRCVSEVFREAYNLGYASAEDHLLNKLAEQEASRQEAIVAEVTNSESETS